MYLLGLEGAIVKILKAWNTLVLNTGKALSYWSAAQCLRQAAPAALPERLCGPERRSREGAGRPLWCSAASLAEQKLVKAARTAQRCSAPAVSCSAATVGARSAGGFRRIPARCGAAFGHGACRFCFSWAEPENVWMLSVKWKISCRFQRLRLFLSVSVFSSAKGFIKVMKKFSWKY